MNNCPKCGNPLEEGVKTCPICGNVITADLNNQTPIEPQNNINNNVDNLNKIEANPGNVAPNPAPVAQATNQTATPVAPIPVTQTPVAETPVARTPVEKTPTVAPTVTQTPSATPVSPQPTPVTTPTSTPIKPLVTDEKPQKNKNKMPLILIAVVGLVLVIGIGISFAFGGGSKEAPKKDNIALETSLVSSNGYKFNLPKTWFIAEDSENVVLTNDDSTLSIKFDHSSSTINSINKSMIDQVISSHEEYSDTSISEIKISAKDAYLVNTKINKMPVQIYFINGGSNLLIGVTVIYQTDESKTKYEPTVTEIIGSLSYADESVKALDIINMYSNIFNMYNSILNYRIPTTEENPTETENQTQTEENNVEASDNQTENNQDLEEPEENQNQPSNQE